MQTGEVLKYLSGRCLSQPNVSQANPHQIRLFSILLEKGWFKLLCSVPVSIINSTVLLSFKLKLGELLVIRHLHTGYTCSNREKKAGLLGA